MSHLSPFIIFLFNGILLVVVDEISLISSRMLTFINCKWHVIKRVHTKFMGGLDIIMTCDFYQAPPIIRNSWIFKSKIDGFNDLTTIVLCKNVTFYELKQVMR